MEQKSSPNEDKRITMNIALQQSEKTFLKVYAAKHNTTVSALIHEYILELQKQDSKES